MAPTHAVVLGGGLAGMLAASVLVKHVDEIAAAGVDEVVVYPVPYGDEPAETVLHTVRVLRRSD